MRNIFYETERLILWPSTPGLAALVADYYTRNRVFFESFDPLRSEEFYTERGQRQELKRDEQDMQKGTAARYWLAPKGGERIIGMVALNNIVLGSFRSAFLAYKLDAEYLNQGYITEGIARVLHIAFEQVGLHRVEANIMPRNAPSLRVVEKLGFQNEGLARKYLNINGVWEDHVHMVLLNEPGEARPWEA